MPVYSQNNYVANDRSVIASFTVPGTTRKISLRKGDTAVILLDILAWIHAHVERIDVGEFDDWGYAERPIRGSTTTLSNHASGTAVDVNAVKHPLGVRNTWTPEQKRLINGRLAYYEGCVRFGENYTGRIDPMHLEIDAGAAACKRVADKIRANPTPTPEDDMTVTAADIRAIVREEVLRVRNDVGFARDQTLTRLGVADTTGAPSTLDPAELAQIEPARRVDVEFALSELRAEIATVRALIAPATDPTEGT